ncbi:MAG: hypothetical protein ABSB23_16315 [Bryobacteraceae bacterium]|jgi:hypothetical protein
MVPAVAVKFAEVAPDATVTEAGTVNADKLLERETAIPPLPAAPDNVTEHVDVSPEFRLFGLHDTWLTTVVATSEMDAVCELVL